MQEKPLSHDPSAKKVENGASQLRTAPLSEQSRTFLTGLTAQGANSIGTVITIPRDAFLSPEQRALEEQSREGLVRRETGYPVVFPVLSSANFTLQLGDEGWYMALDCLTMNIVDGKELWETPFDNQTTWPSHMDFYGNVRLTTEGERVTGISYTPTDIVSITYLGALDRDRSKSELPETPQHLAHVIDAIVEHSQG